MAREHSTGPTADDLKTWATSRLLSCFVQVEIAAGDRSNTFRSSRNAELRKLYAAEIDRRFPVGGR